MQPTRNTLSETIRLQSVQLLNLHLAAAIDLHAQVKQAHWNVRGPAFIGIHELFDRVSTEVEAYSDLLAERARGLGGTAHGTIQVAAASSFLIPYPLGIGDEQAHVFAVSGALAAFGQSVREAIDLAAGFGDANTADLFTQISRGIDQQLWFVESHVAPRHDAGMDEIPRPKAPASDHGTERPPVKRQAATARKVAAAS
jgi:starvation-inducible DNA-binding protein